MDIDEKSKDAITKVIIFSLYEADNPDRSAKAILDGKELEYIEEVMAEYRGMPYGEKQPKVTCNFFYARVNAAVSQILNIIRRVEPNAQVYLF